MVAPLFSPVPHGGKREQIESKLVRSSNAALEPYACLYADLAATTPPCSSFPHAAIFHRSLWKKSIAGRRTSWLRRQSCPGALLWRGNFVQPFTPSKPTDLLQVRDWHSGPGNEGAPRQPVVRGTNAGARRER